MAAITCQLGVGKAREAEGSGRAKNRRNPWNPKNEESLDITRE
jgi:hypothetical protein